jgi:hypothetical protein
MCGWMEPIYMRNEWRAISSGKSGARQFIYYTNQGVAHVHVFLMTHRCHHQPKLQNRTFKM